MRQPACTRVTITALPLEDRTAPIVGAFAAPTPLVPINGYVPYSGVGALLSTATAWDGPNVGDGPKDGTASLIMDTVGANGVPSEYGHHLLTAAHLLTTSKGGATGGSIRFDLSRGGNTVTPVTIPIKQAGIFVNPDYDPSPWYRFKADNDIALVRLIDPGEPAATRLLVKPKGANPYLPNVPWAYGPDPANDSSKLEVGKTVDLVGYGASGTGWTGEIPSTVGKKRAAQNVVDTSKWDYRGSYILTSPKHLAIDFDNGAAANDAFGRRMGLVGLGLGAAEGNIAGGDSGGPWLASISNHVVIAGITSMSDRYDTTFDTNYLPDVDGDINSSFGEVSLATRVSKFSQFIQDSTSIDTYDLVLDMRYQVYGAGTEIDNLTITAKNIDGLLTLTVDGGHRMP